MKRDVMISVIDQGAVSAFNFALNLALLKWWDSEQFGLYSIVFAGSFMLLSVQNALVTTPYSVLVPAARHPNPIRGNLSAINLMLFFVVIILAAVMIPLVTTKLPVNLTGSIVAFLAARWLREYFRAKWAAEFDLLAVLISDLVSIIAFALGIAIWGLQWGWNSIDIAIILWLLAFSNILCSAKMITQEIQILRTYQYRNLLASYAPTWVQSRWSLTGACTTEVQNRGYVLIVGAAFGLDTIGTIQAGRVFFGPLNVITSAWTRVAKPLLAKLHSNDNLAEFKKITHSGSIGFIVFNLLFALFLWLSWPWLKQQFYQNESPDIVWIVAQWAIANLLFHIRGCYSAALQAQNRFKELAQATIWGAIISMVTIMIISFFQLPKFIIASVLVADSFALFYVLNLFFNRKEKRVITEASQ